MAKTLEQYILEIEELINNVPADLYEAVLEEMVDRAQTALDAAQEDDEDDAEED